MLKVQNIDLSLLKPWKDNPRINDEAVDSVAKSIESFGFNVPILCNQEFTIIAGHTRWKAAKKIGMKSVPVIVLKITDDRRKAFAVADNKTARLADWDYLKLRKILVKLNCKKFNLSSPGYSRAELQALLVKQKEFDWKAFEERFKNRFISTYVLVPIKVLSQKKDRFNKAIKSLASKYGIRQGDFAKAAGEVLEILLGLSQ